MKTDKGDSRPATCSGSPNQIVQNTQYPAPHAAAAAATMSEPATAVSSQASIIHDAHRHASLPPHKSSADSSKVADIKSQPGEKPTTDISERAPGKAKPMFQRCQEAYSRPIEGMQPIPSCLMKRKPHIRRLIRSRRSSNAPAKESTDPELQALNTPIAPVNKDTTKELELPAIQNNTSLRIDLCYDDQLFFQPIKGRKGEEKQRRARIFWECLSLELDAYKHALCGPCPECANEPQDSDTTHVEIPSRLAEFFSALRDLIEMLVPEKDKELILRRLKVDELVQESRTGVFDAVEFSGWLAQLLMTHCAPLRDAMARKMNQQISDGARTGDMDLLVKGLETLLSLLENMKLDVANHQVRSFKLLLIADTVPFLQDCFSKMQADQQLDPKGSRKWFKELKRRHLPENVSDFDIFVSGTVKLCRSPCPSKAIPATFTYDKDRLVCLRNEVLDLTQLRICTNTFEEIVMRRQRRKPTAAECTKVRDRLLQLMSAEDGTSEGVACHLDEIATEIAHAAKRSSTAEKPQDPSCEVQDVDFQYALNRLETRFAIEQFSVMETILQDLTKLTLQFASQFQKLDTLQLSNAQRVWTAKRSTKDFALAPEIEDIARRLAHIIVIHWAVWAKLVYVEDDSDKSTQVPINQDEHSDLPVAHSEVQFNSSALSTPCQYHNSFCPDQI